MFLVSNIVSHSIKINLKRSSDIQFLSFYFKTVEYTYLTYSDYNRY